MAGTGTVTAQQVAERLLRRAAPSSETAGDIASAAAALVDLAHAGDVSERAIDQVVAEHTAAGSRRGGGERPLSEVNFLTVVEVAAALRVSRMTVYRLVHSGELPAIRVGRSFRVPEQAVNDYLWDLHDAAQQVRNVIATLVHRHPGWGPERIHAEVQRQGFDASLATVQAVIAAQRTA